MRRQYPSPKQVARLTELAREAGITLVGSVTFGPDGTVSFTDARYLKQRQVDEAAAAAAELEAALGSS